MEGSLSWACTRFMITERKAPRSMVEEWFFDSELKQLRKFNVRWRTGEIELSFS